MVTITARFNGPLRSGNGGYCSGLIGSQVDTDGPATATLRLPPPLDVPLSWEHDGSTVRLLTAGGAVVGEGAPGGFTRPVPVAPGFDEARAAEQAYGGHDQHPFGHCFTCGTERDEGDGLRIFTGPVGPDTTAATWTPHPDQADPDGLITEPIVWAAIDCAGGWAADFTLHPTVLGRMTAQVLRVPEVGEPCVVTGHLSGQDGRKFVTETALYSGEELLARAEQVWIEIDPALFG